MSSVGCDDQGQCEGHEGTGQDGHPEEADRLADGLSQGHAAHGALGHGQEPQDQDEEARGGEDDGVLPQEAWVGEVDLGGGVDGGAELVEHPGGGLRRKPY